MRQTFRVRPFPTACIMHATAGCFDDDDDVDVDVDVDDGDVDDDARSKVPFALISLGSPIGQPESWFAGHCQFPASRGIIAIPLFVVVRPTVVFPRPIGQPRLRRLPRRSAGSRSACRTDTDRGMALIPLRSHARIFSPLFL